MGWSARVLGVGATVGTMACFSVAPVFAGESETVVVPPGGSIQTAVNTANPGDTIRLQAGTYHENVFLTTDRLTLRGAGAGKTILLPPTPDNGSGCGICIAGAQDSNGAFTHMATGDRVSDLTVQGFAFAGVFGFGTDQLQVTHVDAAFNGGYGISRFVSTRTLFKDNRAWGSGEAGFYIGDSPDADTLVINNQAWNNDLGIFVRHAHGVTLRENNAWNNCFGVLVLDDGQPGGAGDVTISDNHFNGNSRFCAGGDNAPPHGGAGVVLLGAVRSTVRDNEVKDNHIDVAQALGRGGIVLISANMPPFLTGSDPINNTVTQNDLRGNVPADIVWDGSGSGNRFPGNDCKTSIPVGFCHAD